jgi:integrase/recombinase XerD
MTTRAVEKLIDRYVAALGLDAAVTVHSLRVTALTTARERGSDIIDLQDFAGYGEFSITCVMPRPLLCGVP